MNENNDGLTALLGTEAVPEDEPSLPGWETAEFGAPPRRETRDRESRRRPQAPSVPPRRSAFDEVEEAEEASTPRYGGGRGRGRQDTRNQPKARDASFGASNFRDRDSRDKEPREREPREREFREKEFIDPRDIDPRDIDPRSAVSPSGNPRGGNREVISNDLDPRDIDPRDIDPRDVDPREGGSRGRRGRVPEASTDDKEDDDRGGNRRRRRRRGRGRGVNESPVNTERGASPPPRDFPDDEVHDVEGGDDLWAEVGDDDHEVKAPTPVRPKSPARVTFDDDHEDAEEVVAMRRGRRRRRLSNEPSHIDEEVAEPSAKDRPRERSPAPEGRRTGRRPQPERRIEDDSFHDLDVPADEIDAHEDLEPIATHRNIPTWLDAVDILINANMDSRRREPQRRGRGNGPQGGNGGHRRR